MNNRTNAISLKAFIRVLPIALAALLLVGGSTANAQGWHFGVGTGITFQNIEGTQGYNIVGHGPVAYDIDLDPEQFSDAMQSGFGLGVFATNGKWMITYAGGQVKLGGDGGGDISADLGGGTFTYDMEFVVSSAKLTVGNTVYRSKNMKFGFTPYIGMRYMKHEMSADISLTQEGETTWIYKGRDHSWTDALVGVGVSYALMPKLHWAASGDAGFGGSDGTFYFNTSLMLAPVKHFSIGPTFSYTTIDFENGEIGDADWYMYDADEFGAGVAFAISF